GLVVVAGLRLAVAPIVPITSVVVVPRSRDAAADRLNVPADAVDRVAPRGEEARRDEQCESDLAHDGHILLAPRSPTDRSGREFQNLSLCGCEKRVRSAYGA